MTRARIPVPAADPSIKVGINMPASVYQRLREFCDLTGTSISKLCRDGALREIEQAEAPEAT